MLDRSEHRDTQYSFAQWGPLTKNLFLEWPLLKLLVLLKPVFITPDEVLVHSVSNCVMGTNMHSMAQTMRKTLRNTIFWALTLDSIYYFLLKAVITIGTNVFLI